VRWSSVEHFLVDWEMTPVVVLSPTLTNAPSAKLGQCGVLLTNWKL
jgi:hypothetical protein